MAREPYRGVELTEGYRPVAAPVDTFVTAQVPSRDNSLQDLARSLSVLGGSLGELMGKRDREAEENDRIQGRAAFWEANGVGAAEAISKGLMPAQANPNFIRGWKETEGSVAGAQLQEKFSAAYDTWEGKSSTDPQAFAGFLGGFIKDNVKTNDPDVLRGLWPQVEQLRANWQNKHIGDVSRAAQQSYTTAMAARGDQLIDQANTAGLASKSGTDYGKVFGELEAIRADGLRRGANEAQTDEKLIDTITAAAITKRDPKLLDFLDRKVPGKDYAWTNTPYGREQRQKTVDTLETMGRREVAEAETKRKAEKAEQKDAVTRDSIRWALEHPKESVPEELLARGEKLDPDFRLNVLRNRKLIESDRTTSDPDELTGLTHDIMLRGGGIQAVQRAWDRGVFRNRGDLEHAVKLAEGMQKDGPKIDAMTKLPAFRDLVATIKKRTASEKDANKIFDDGSFSPEGLQASADITQMALQWLQTNPDAGPIEQNKALAEIGANVLGRITQPEDRDKIFYDRQGLSGPNAYGAAQPPAAGSPRAVPTPQAPAARPDVPRDEYGMPRLDLDPAQPMVPNPLAPPPAAPQPTAPAPSQPQATTPAKAPAAPASPPSAAAAPSGQPAGEAQGWFNGLPPEFRGELERMAATEKKPLQMKVEELYRKGRAAGSIPAPVAPAAPAPAPAAPAAPAAPGKRSEGPQAPDGTPIETASVTASTAEDFSRAIEGAYVGRATFDGTKATLNGQTFTAPASPEAVARKFEGLSEADPQHRAVLTDFLSKAAGQRIDPAKVPWCAAFVDAVLDASGKPKRGSLRAADFLDYGTATDKPTKGDVVVFRSMAQGSSGHVGFVVGIEGDRVRYIAGNDDNKVQEDTLPLAKVAGFRRPPEAGTGPFGADAGQAAGAFSRVLGTTGQPTGGYALPELKADLKAARILDLVTGAELNQANAGNYNAFFGNAGATEDLSKRTLDQTIAWSRDRGTSSSATGRYQMMADTMVGLKKEMGLSGTEAFTPELQDRMALRLLARRGYREWATGKLSAEDFANNLAKEWASLPNLTTGRSHYAGDGVNKALVTPAQVRSVLEGTGAFPAARLASVTRTLTAPGAGSRFLSRVRGMFGGGSGPEVTSAPVPEAAPVTSKPAPLPAAAQASHAHVLAGLEPEVASVVRRAQADNPNLRLVAWAGRGGRVEVRAVGPDGRPIPTGDGDEVGDALQRAAGQLGVGVNWAPGKWTLSSVKKTIKA